MALYKPTTLNDFDYNARTRAQVRRLARTANIPGRTQTYQTTDKVGAESARIDQAVSDAAAAKVDAEGALLTAQGASDAAVAARASVDALSATVAADYLKASDAASTYATKAALEALDEKVGAMSTGLPVGAVVITSSAAPAMGGTWTEVTAFHIPLSADPTATYHLYERTA